MKNNYNKKIKILKTFKKRLNEEFQSVRGRRSRREIIYNTFRIFHVVESFTEIKVRRESGRRQDISYCKLKILIIKRVIRSNERSLPFYFLLPISRESIVFGLKFSKWRF